MAIFGRKGAGAVHYLSLQVTFPQLKMNDFSNMDKQARRFSFAACEYHPASGEATLSYDIDGQTLQEKITFPGSPWPQDASRREAFYRALELLHLIAGISYYKAGLARLIDTGSIRVDQELADFLNDLYLRGLGEFAYINQLDLAGLIDFQVTINETASAISGQDGRRTGRKSSPLDLPGRALVAMGGGKDSLVCLQMLKGIGLEVQPVCVGGSNLIGETSRAAGLPLIRIHRKLSAGLAVMNADGAWNGHVPVTAINSAILLCAGLLYGHRYVVFANESSASEATLVNEHGKEINHQYSKSLDFELALRRMIKSRVSPDIEYFSLLRPFNEIAITRRFSELTDFHTVFSSCNRNFHQDGSHIEGRWCQDCPKCRFTALALAPFLSSQQLLAIQGRDLLNQKNQLQGFKALCGLGEHKPFECVGSIAESRAVLKHLSTLTQYRDKYVVSTLSVYPEIRQSGEIELEPDFESEHCIPAEILAKLSAI